MLDRIPPRLHVALAASALSLVLLHAPAAGAQDDESDVDIEIEIEAEPEDAPEPLADDEAEGDADGDAPEPLTDDDAEGDADPDRVSPPGAPDATARADSPATEDIQALRDEVRALRARLDELAEPPPETAPPVAAADDADDDDEEDEGGLSLDPQTGFVHAPGGVTLRLSGYVQLQYQHDDLSRDELLPGGAFLNQDGFVVRRGRLRLEGSWEMLRVGLELDGSTTRGPFVGVRRAFVSARYPFDDPGAEPLVALTAGLTTIPFGFEVRQPNEERLFMERTTASLAFFRGPVDVGARLHGRLGPFEYDLGAFNGTPLDDRAGAPGIDPTGAPDLVGRLGVVGGPSDDVRLGGGVSYVYGTGFHAGEDAGKDHVEWQDLNENGRLDNGELVPVPGRAALPSETFERWAVGADARLELRTPIGWTRVWVEAALASNLDRAFFVADPFVTGQDVRELAVWAGLTQQITEYGVVGFRYDYYDPNADWLDEQRGRRVPRDASIHTLSPLVGLELPGRGRLIFQYDVVLDSLARDARGVPTDLKNDRWTVRLQGSF